MGIALIYPEMFQISGIPRYIESYLRALPAEAPEHLLITCDQSSYAFSDHPRVSVIHIPLMHNRWGLMLWGLKVRRLLQDLFQSGRISMVNFHWVPLIPGLFLPGSIPMVLTAHTTYWGMTGRCYRDCYYPSQWGTLSYVIRWCMEKWLLSHARQVITLTEQGAFEIAAYGYRGPVTVIPNGTDVTRFNPDLNQEKDFEVVFCGRIETRKGSRAMVQVCEALIRVQPQIRIVIVGIGHDDHFVLKRLSRLPQITFTGEVAFQEAVTYYSRSRIYVSSSYYEGLPGTCLEAMAMALPVVVWDFAFYHGLVCTEVHGKVVRPNDVAGMAAAICDLLADPDQCRRLGQNGRAHVESVYAWPLLAPRIIAALSDQSAGRV